MEGLESMKHYDYQTKITCACLDKLYFDTDEKQIPQWNSVSSMTSMSTNTGNTNKISRMSKHSLNPLNGSLKHILNSAPPYWRTKSSNEYHYCQLYYWATGNHTYQNMVLYKECNVVLCMDGCYERFHIDWDLVEKKSVATSECEENIISIEKR